MFESFSRSPILLEIVENWYTKCQGHKKRWPHFLSLRQVVKHLLDAVYVVMGMDLRLVGDIGNCTQMCKSGRYLFEV